MDGFDHVPFNNMNALRDAIGPETAGILVEPVQGEGGIRTGTPDFLRGLRAACDEFGMLLGLDEVQCGMGRTGKLFAHEWAGIEPDVMSAAKGIAGGFPMGAILAKEAVAKYLVPGTHGTTFGGNPLACAAGQCGAGRDAGAGLPRGRRSARANACGRCSRRSWREYPNVVSEVRGAGADPRPEVPRCRTPSCRTR